MEHPWFQPGDRVRVRQWDDMEREYGRSGPGDSINVPFFFVESMKQYCGVEFVVTDVYRVMFNGGECQRVEGLSPLWSLSNAMLEYADLTPVCEIGTIDDLL